MGICLTLNTATDRCQPVDLGGRLGGGIDQGLQPGARLIIHLDVDRGITSLVRPAVVAQKNNGQGYWAE